MLLIAPASPCGTWTVSASVVEPLYPEFSESPHLYTTTAPCSLQGTYLRNGPGRFERDAGYEHPFDGDGYLQQLTVRRGVCARVGSRSRTRPAPQRQKNEHRTPGQCRPCTPNRPRSPPGASELGWMHSLDARRRNFHLLPGRASVRTRYVRTAEFAAEEAAGKILYRNAFGAMRETPQWEHPL